MALNSINTNIAAYFAQTNIGKASQSASLSIARLSSGSRIVRAADDVAAVSAGTSLRTNVTTLRIALINTSQGASLLQVADGALNQITDILQRQKAIAVQAGSGSLSSAERGFLNQEFQNLTQEIDRLATQTNFNGVSLLDGVLTKTVQAQDVATAADSSTGSISFTVNAATGETIILNGQTVTIAAAPTTAQVQLGLTIEETVSSLATFLNAAGSNTALTAANRAALSQASYEADGNTLRITAKAGGIGGQNYIIGGTGTFTDNTDAAIINAPNVGSYLDIFAVAIGPANVTDAAVAAAATATVPFATATTLSAGIGVTAAAVIATLTTGDSLNDIINQINTRTNIHGFTASIVGRSGAYNIRLAHANPDLDNEAATTDGGDIGLTLPAGALNNAGAAVAAAGAGTTTHIRASGLGGGGSTGIGVSDTVGVGVTGDNILTDHSQTKSSISILFPDITPANLATILVPTAATAVQIDIGDAATAGEFDRFTFTTSAKEDAGPQEIALGATLEETIDNAVEVINNYRGVGYMNFDLDQIRARRDGNNLIIETKDYGDAIHLDISAAVITTNVNLALQNAAAAGVSITNSGALSNGTTTGVTTKGVTNDAFVGQISGFEAVYNSTADTVNLSVTVGDHTYTALNVDTTATAATTVRLSSESGGGYFDLELRANSGTSVNSQANADTFASRLDAAFSTLEFYQGRNISNYNGSSPIVSEGVVTGSLAGTTVKLHDVDFSDVKIEDINVTAPTGSNPNGSITITINGEEYTSASNIGGYLGAHQKYTLLSATSANRFLEFTTGDDVIEFDTAAKAAAFQEALNEAFGVGEGNAALTFQVGVTTSDTLRVGISGVTADDLDLSTLDVTTQENAALAADALDVAIDLVTSVRAEVGALQSRFDFAAANIESSIQNQDAARGVLLDTDIASESTSFATSQVQLQAGIAVLAQANLLPQNLLKLIG